MLPAIAVFLLAMATSASEWYVSTNGTGAGTNWATAFTSVQTALSTATNGDFIYIKGGTYAVMTQLNWTNSGVTVMGAYKGTNTVGPGPFNVTNWPTVLRRPGTPASTNRIMFVKGANGGTLGRVTLSDGWLNTASAVTGGCLCVIGSSGLTLSSLTVAGGKIALNSPLSKGGGVFIADSINVTIADSTIRDNNVDAGNNNVADGCGIYARNTILTITNCSIRNNSGGYSTRGAAGAGVYFKDCRVTVADTAIHGNYSAAGVYQWHSGGGIYVSGGTNLFRNCLIAGNDNLYHGGSPGRGWSHGDGAYLYSGVSTFVNCTVVMNNGEGIYCNAGSVAVTNCILWDNLDDLVNFPTNAAGVLTGVWYCNVENGDNAGTNGCISSDPLFERGLYLATNSPCVNAGSSPAGTAGLAGRTIRADGVPDSATVDLGYHFAGGILGGPRDKLYVSPSGTDTNTGTGWSTAFRSITRALSVAGHGTRINIATGLYSSACETFPLTISGLFGVELLGTNAAATLIKPTGSGKRGFNIKGVGFLRIHGLSITGANPSTYTPGSAAYIGNSRLTVSSCSISSNGCWPVDGGAIWMKDTFLTMTNCTLVKNTSSSDWGNYGGGIYAEGGQLVLLDSFVLNNSASPSAGGTAGGGGIYLGGTCGARHMIRNCVFTGNRLTSPANNHGAGLYLATTTSIRNCVFAFNGMSRGTKLGSAVFVGAGHTTIENCTVASNSPEGIRQNTAGNVLEIRNSILWSNSDDIASADIASTLANLWYSDIEDGDNNNVNGCISTDPLFANPASDWHLRSHGGRWTPGDIWVKDVEDSPCIDAGDPASDHSKEPQVNGGRINMGAYGNTSQASKPFARGTVWVIM